MVTENLLSTMSQHMNEALQSGVWNQKINQSFIQRVGFLNSNIPQRPKRADANKLNRTAKQKSKYLRISVTDYGFFFIDW